MCSVLRTAPIRVLASSGAGPSEANCCQGNSLAGAGQLPGADSTGRQGIPWEGVEKEEDPRKSHCEKLRAVWSYTGSLALRFPKALGCPTTRVTDSNAIWKQGEQHRWGTRQVRKEGARQRERPVKRRPAGLLLSSCQPSLREVCGPLPTVELATAPVGLCSLKRYDGNSNPWCL